MTNIRLRIEDAIPTVGFGSVGNMPRARANPTVSRSLAIAYRMAPVTSTTFETI